MFGEYFKKLRNDKEFTQRQVAEVIGKTPMYVSLVEQGKNNPFREKDLAEIAKLFMLSNDERRRLYSEASRTSGKMPKYLFDYILQHENSFRLIEVLAENEADNAFIDQIIKQVEEKR